MNRWVCPTCGHRWDSKSPAVYWCPSCGRPVANMRPLFVALEGIDACGKGTQAERLRAKLKGTLFSFPDYRTPIGGLIDGHLKRRWRTEGLDHAKEALVFQALQSANRLERATDLATELAEGRPVVADRYTMSGVVYGAADGRGRAYLEDLHRYLPQPDVWILLDIDPEVSAERRPERRDRYESDPEFMRRVCLLYRQVWVANGWAIVDARGSVADVAGQIWDVVKDR